MYAVKVDRLRLEPYEQRLTANTRWLASMLASRSSLEKVVKSNLGADAAIAESSASASVGGSSLSFVIVSLLVLVWN